MHLFVITYLCALMFCIVQTWTPWKISWFYQFNESFKVKLRNERFLLYVLIHLIIVTGAGPSLKFWVLYSKQPSGSQQYLTLAAWYFEVRAPYEIRQAEKLAKRKASALHNVTLENRGLLFMFLKHITWSLGKRYSTVFTTTTLYLSSVTLHNEGWKFSLKFTCNYKIFPCSIL